MFMFRSTCAATPLPSWTRPSKMCSVPRYSWLNRCASWRARFMTFLARSVKRSNMGVAGSVAEGRAPLMTLGMDPRSSTFKGAWVYRLRSAFSLGTLEDGAGAEIHRHYGHRGAFSKTLPDQGVLGWLSSSWILSRSRAALS